MTMRKGRYQPVGLVPDDGADGRVGHIQSAKDAIIGHPWTTMWIAFAIVVAVVGLGYVMRGRDVPAIPVQESMPVGVAMPTVVEMKDGKSGCAVRLYYDGDRLVSVLPGQKRNGELDCPET